MSSTGIGAPVRRKEDKRFVTGKGRYVDDINRPGQAHAYFVRSPHAHATIKSVDTSAALKMPGVVAIYTGEDVAADKVGGLICGWMIHSKDGSPMKAGAHPARHRQVLPGGARPGLRPGAAVPAGVGLHRHAVRQPHDPVRTVVTVDAWILDHQRSEENNQLGFGICPISLAEQLPKTLR